MKSSLLPVNPGTKTAHSDAAETSVCMTARCVPRIDHVSTTTPSGRSTRGGVLIPRVRQAAQPSQGRDVIASTCFTPSSSV